MGRRNSRGGGNRAWNPFRNEAKARQDAIYRMYKRVLGELAMNRFEWKGFEDTGVDVRYLELTLYRTALSVVFRDTATVGRGTDQIFALRGAPKGFVNLVDNPTSFILTGPGFNSKTVFSTQCVPIWSNYFREPDLDIVDIYAWKLARLDRTIEINSDNARRSKVLVYNETQALTAQNIQDQIDSGQPFIGMNYAIGDMVQAVDMGIDPRSITELSVLRSRLWNECMGLLGINNSNQDKKERLVAAEVGANDDQVESARRANLNARQTAAAQISEMFDLDVTVDYYSGAPVETVNPATNEQTGAASA